MVSMTTLRPSEIRFIQDSIKWSFQDGESVNAVAEEVCSRTKSVRSFPTIQVVKRNNKYYSFDNRRLYVFRIAEYRGVIADIPVRIVPESRLDLNRFTTKNDGRTVEVRGARTLDHCKPRWLRTTPEILMNFASVSNNAPRPITPELEPTPHSDHEVST